MSSSSSSASSTCSASNGESSTGAAGSEVDAAPRDLPSVFTILTSDDFQFEMDYETLKQTRTLYKLTENLDGSTFHEQPIRLESVKGRTMKRIVEWCVQHKTDPAPRSPSSDQRGASRTVVIPPWDGLFLAALKNGELFELICAANYLEIPLLMDYSCKSVANMAKGKSPDEMRLIFGIRSDEEDEEAALYEAGPSYR